MQGDDLKAVLSFYAPDIEFVRFGRTYRGIDALREVWSRPVAEEGFEHLDAEFEIGQLEDLGDGRVSTWSHVVFRWKESGELAYERRASADYLVLDGKIARCELATITQRYGKA